MYAQEAKHRHAHISSISVADAMGRRSSADPESGRDSYNPKDKDHAGPLTWGEKSILAFGGIVAVTFLLMCIHPELYHHIRKETVLASESTEHASEKTSSWSRRTGMSLLLDGPPPTFNNSIDFFGLLLANYTQNVQAQKPIPGWATSNATATYAANYKRHSDHFALISMSEDISPTNLMLSTIGIGSYLGKSDDLTANQLSTAVTSVIGGGINVLDTSINYLGQLAERSLGKAIRRAVVTDAIVPREALFIATKIGYIPRDARRPDSTARSVAKEWAEEWNFATRVTYSVQNKGTPLSQSNPDPSSPHVSVFPMHEIVNDKHCIAPACIDMSLRASLRNLGVETIDLVYLHNIELQYLDDDLTKDEVLSRVIRAFRRLELYRSKGQIRYYGLATWDGLRNDVESHSHIWLQDMWDAAVQVGGQSHGFRFIQLPISVGMPEAVLNSYENRHTTVLETAKKLGLTVMGSRSVDGASPKPLVRTISALTHCSPDERAAELKGEQAAGSSEVSATTKATPLSFVAQSLNVARSTPGVAVSLVGMKESGHVSANVGVLKLPKLTVPKVLCIYEAAASAAKVQIENALDSASSSDSRDITETVARERAGREDLYKYRQGRNPAAAIAASAGANSEKTEGDDYINGKKAQKVENSRKKRKPLSKPGLLTRLSELLFGTTSTTKSVSNAENSTGDDDIKSADINSAEAAIRAARDAQAQADTDSGSLSARLERRKSAAPRHNTRPKSKGRDK